MIYFGNSAEKLLEEKYLSREDILCKSSLNEVHKNFKLTGYNMDNVNFIKGEVEKTIPENMPANISLLRLDTDWYESNE